MKSYLSVPTFVGCSLVTSVKYLFIVLNLAQLGIQDETSTMNDTSSMSGQEDNVYHKYLLKPGEKHKLYEIQYSLKETLDIINSPEFADLPVVQKIKAMWTSNKTRKLIQKKPRKRRKNATTTTMASAGIDVTTLYETTTHYETTTRLRPPGRQNPFVLIEGTLTTARRRLLRGLMKYTTFLYVRNFRQIPFKYRDKFNRYDLLRLKRAFVTLQLYITGRDIEKFLEERPVIMSGFWMRHVAEYLSRKYLELRQLPPAGSPCYKWPSDLPRPDLVYFLHIPCSENVKPETIQRIDRILEIYRRMDPAVVFLDQSYNNVTEKRGALLRKSTIEKLAPKFPNIYGLIKARKTSENKLKKGSKKSSRKNLKKSLNSTVNGGSIPNKSLNKNKN